MSSIGWLGAVGVVIGSLAFGCSGGGPAASSAAAGAGGVAAGDAGASAAGQGGSSLPGGGVSAAGGIANGGGTPSASGAGGNGGGALGSGSGAGGSSGAAGSIPASAAMPCGAACDAAGYQCIADECHAAEGALLWQLRLNERYAEQMGDMASDSKGNAIVGFGADIRAPFLADRLFVRKFDKNGGQVWEHAFLGDQYGVLSAVAVDAQDRIYVGGGLGYGAATAFVRILDADGKLIQQIVWKADELRLVDHFAFDAAGNVFITGTKGLPQVRPVIVKKLDPNGKELWSKQYHDGGLHYSGFHVATTAAGNVLLATGTNTNPASAFLGGYDPSGTSLWSDTYAAGQHTQGTGIMEWDNAEVLAVGTQDKTTWLRRYSAAGVLLKSNTVSDDGRVLTSIAGRGGALYVGGAAFTSGYPLQAWISKVNNDGQVAGWHFADTLGAFVYGRDVEKLAVTPQGDVLAYGTFDWHSNRNIWLARFAGPAGGVPRVDVNSVAHLTTNTYPDHDDSPIFTDAEVPECDAKSSYQITGTLGGAALTYQGATTSVLDPTSFQALPSMTLRWKDFVQEGTGIPLTGDHLVLPTGQPHAGETLCITGGDFAVLPATYTPDSGRELKFRITAGSLGADCKGATIAVAIKGCFYRFTDYLP